MAERAEADTSLLGVSLFAVSLLVLSMLGVSMLGLLVDVVGADVAPPPPPPHAGKRVKITNNDNQTERRTVAPSGCASIRRGIRPAGILY